jgi:hypothetical protein
VPVNVGERMRKTPVVVLAILVAIGVAAILSQSSRPATVVAPTSSTPHSTQTPIADVPTPTLVPTSEPALRPDGMATVAAPGGVVVWSAPGTKKAKALTPALPTGARLFLTRGPRHAHGFDWWEVQVEYKPGLSPFFGWIHASEGDRATIAPFAPDCPPSDTHIDQARLVAIGTLESLACFDGRDITVQGDLACYDAAVDRIVGGASWLGTNYSCSMNSAFYMEGPVVAGLNGGRRPAIGWYEVRGHFDDPESTACSWIPFGTSLTSPSGHPDPGAVIACRQAFVVTAVTKLP